MEDSISIKVPSRFTASFIFTTQQVCAPRRCAIFPRGRSRQKRRPRTSHLRYKALRPPSGFWSCSTFARSQRIRRIPRPSIMSQHITLHKVFGRRRRFRIIYTSPLPSHLPLLILLISSTNRLSNHPVHRRAWILQSTRLDFTVAGKESVDASGLTGGELVHASVVGVVHEVVDGVDTAGTAGITASGAARSSRGLGGGVGNGITTKLPVSASSNL